jgi:hypothetical protein
MSGSSPDGASWDRYRSDNFATVKPEGQSAETWNWATDDTVMAATSGTGSVSRPSPSSTDEASISQKMLSATLGSVLNGLLGRRLYLCPYCRLVRGASEPGKILTTVFSDPSRCGSRQVAITIFN